MNEKYKASGIQRNTPTTNGEIEGFKFGEKGQICFTSSCIEFNKWRIKNKNIKSSFIRINKYLFWETYHLSVTDGIHDYLFNIPGKAFKAGLPFDCEVIEKKNLLLNVYLYLMLIGFIFSIIGLFLGMQPWSN